MSRSVAAALQCATLLLCVSGVLWAQQATGGDTSASGAGTGYVLGPNDEILVWALDVEEISNKILVIDSDGIVNLPLVGKIRAGGRTLQEFERDLNERLSAFVKKPQVIVNLGKLRSDPIVLVGAFRNPGVHQLQGRKTLLEFLASVGGLQPTASRRIKITRKRESGIIPLPGVVTDSDRNVSSIEIDMTNMMESMNSAENILLKPYDLLSVERAEMVYVSGEFGKAGGIALEDRAYVSVMQLIAMAGGLNKEADLERSRILRPILNTAKRAEIPVNIKHIMAGRANDCPVLPNDILLVPRSSAKTALARSSLILIPTLVSSMMFLIFNNND